MSIRQKLLKAISKDPRTTLEIVEETRFERDVVTSNMRAMCEENLSERLVEDGSIVYKITDKGRSRIGNPNAKAKKSVQATARHQPQPEVGSNTGSAGSVSPPAVSATEARASTSTASAKTIKELKDALDKITELKAKIFNQDQRIRQLELVNENLRKECDNLERAALKAPHPEISMGIAVRHIGEAIGDGYILTIEKDVTLTLVDKETDQEYGGAPDEIFQIIEALRFLDGRKVA